MNVFELYAEIKANTEPFQQAVGSLGKIAGGAMKAVGIAVGVGSAAIAGFSASAIKTGQEFDSSMSQIAATLGLTTEDIKNNVNGAGDTFDALRMKAKEMGSATNFSAAQAAEGLNILAMSGFFAEQSMSMVEDVLHLAAAGGMEMADAAGYVSGAMKGFADESKSAGYYADLMAKGATLANTSVSQLGDAMSSGAAGAAAYGQSAESMTVALLRLAEQGDVGAAAGTALSAAMKNLYTPTTQAKKAMDALGVSAYDANGNARDFNEVVNELEASMGNMTEEQKNATKQTIFGIQGLNAYNKMTVTGIEKQDEWADALAKASEGAGEAAKQYNTMTDNLQGDIDIWNSALDGFKISISDKLMPTIRNFVQFGSEGLSKITQAFEQNGLDGAMEAFGQVLSDGLNMIIEMLPQFVDAGMKLLGSLGQGILDNLPTIIDAAVEIIVSLIEGLANSIPRLIEAAGTLMVSLVNALIKNAPRLLQSAKQMISNIVTGLKNNLPNLLSTGQSLVSSLVRKIASNLPSFLSKGADFVAKMAQGLINKLPDLISKMGDLLTRLLNYIMQNLPSFLAKGVEIIGKIASGLLQALPKIISAIAQVIRNLLTTIAQNFPQLLQKGIEIIGKIVSGLIQAIPNIISAVRQIPQKIFEIIKNTNWLELGANIISGIVNGLVNGISSIVNAISNVASSAISAAKNFLGIKSPSKLFRDVIGANIVDGWVEGIEDGEDDVRKAIKNLSGVAVGSIDINSAGAAGLGSGGYTQNITINAPKQLQPSEVARITRNETKNMVLSLRTAT